MNINTKIASEVLALRMKNVIPNLFNYDQTADVKGRFIGKFIRLTDGILYHVSFYLNIICLFVGPTALIIFR